MRIGIIGVGFVGGALRRWFEKNTDHELRLYDPAKGLLDDMDHCVATFICVPCPTVNGTQDYTLIEKAIYMSSGVVFIRSTVLPGTNDKYGTYSCPEFLTERTAFEDVERMDVLTGYPNMELMRQIFPNKNIVQISNKECEISKYAHNAFGALKVNFFNLIYGICQDESADFEAVRKAMFLSGYINEPCTLVPGPDKSFGYGGKCFPKDLVAFNGMYPRLSFRACIHENNVHRLGPNTGVLPDLDIPSSDTVPQTL